MKKGQSFHIASSKGCHYSGLTLLAGSRGTVQPRGPLKGKVSCKFWIEIKSLCSQTFLGSSVLLTVPGAPRTHNLEWEVALQTNSHKLAMSALLIG